MGDATLAIAAGALVVMGVLALVYTADMALVRALAMSPAFQNGNPISTANVKRLGG